MDVIELNQAVRCGVTEPIQCQNLATVALVSGREQVALCREHVRRIKAIYEGKQDERMVLEY